MRVARNVAIILLLALVVAAVPGGGNLARGLVAAMTIAFLVIIGFSGYVFFRQNRLAYVTLPEPLRALLVGALGAIALMVAGADELLRTGAGTIVWLCVLGAAAYGLVRVFQESRAL